MSWEHNGYVYYGEKDIPALKDPQLAKENNCWARALAALVGLSWSTVAMYSSLDDLIKGQSTVNTRNTVEALNKMLEKEQSKLRYSETARWFSGDWGKDMLEKKFPCALGIDGHFVVALGIGYPKVGNGKPRICYWDTDCNIYYDDLETFVKKENPECSWVLISY
jgi:hypothetical protein